MKTKVRIQNFLLNSFPVNFLKKILLPGLSISLWDFLIVYVRGLIKGALTLRASAVAWSLFLGAFPFILVAFAILPYLPHYKELENYIFNEGLNSFFPKKIAEYVGSRIKGIINNRDYSLFNFTTPLILFFASNGFLALLNGFYKTGRNVLEKINFIKSYFLAMIYTLSVTLLVGVALLLTYYSNFVWPIYLKTSVTKDIPIFVIKGFVYSSFFLLHFLFMVFLYYFGTKARIKRNIKQIVPGAILTSVLFFLSIFLFKYYIKWFNNYEILYGSVGVILVVMLWIYLNVIIILIGFELNIAITYSILGIRSKEPEDFTLDDEDI